MGGKLGKGFTKGGKTEEIEGKKYDHGFSSAEVNTLAAIAEAVFPSLSPSSSCFERRENQTISKAVRSFMETSASQSPIPEEVKKIRDWIH